MNPAKPEMKTFFNMENLTNLIKENTCFKGARSCIHLILTNSKYSFQYSMSVETGLIDHHHWIFSMMKTKLALEQPKRLSNFKSFNNYYFEEELSSKRNLNKEDCAISEENFVDVRNKHHLKRQIFLGLIIK